MAHRISDAHARPPAAPQAPPTFAQAPPTRAQATPASAQTRAKLACLAVAVLLASGCALNRAPINQAFGASPAGPDATELLQMGDLPGTAVALSFSGGGTRAAAFSFGVLEQLDRLPLAGDRQGRTMLDAVDLVSGVSGGSITAAYFALKQRAALEDFRERFLVQDVEASLATSLSPGNLLNVVSAGGANSSHSLANWLDRNLFEGATYRDFRRNRNQPTVWITATDLNNRTPFLFSRDTFQALCSSLDDLPVAQAVAASAAFPFAFAPVNVESFAGGCATPLPAWTMRAHDSPVVRASAGALQSYRGRAGGLYVKLTDGGITDNFGVQGIALARSVSDSPYAPLSPRTAAGLRRVLFVLVNAERGAHREPSSLLAAPSGAEMAGALLDSSTDSAAHAGFEYFRLVIAKWRRDMVEWRCSLSAAALARLGPGGVRRCDDLEMTVTEISFADAGPEREHKLRAIPSSFHLPVDSVDFLIESGSIAAMADHAFGAFVRARPPQGSTPGRHSGMDGH